MKVLKSLTSIQSQYEAVIAAIGELKSEQKALKKAGILYGTPTYKQGKYLRIVRPATEDRGRQFEYVGADPDKQQAVLEAIQRGKKYDDAGDQIKALEKALQILDGDLSSLANQFQWSHKLPIARQRL